MTVPPPPPLEYDPESGTYRAAERFSKPTNLLWALVFALIVVGVTGLVGHGFTWSVVAVWGAALLMAALLVGVDRWSGRRRRARRPAEHG